MSSQSGSLYQSLFKVYKNRYPDKTPAVCQKEVNELWKTAKQKFEDFKNLQSYINEVIVTLQQEITKQKANKILSFFKNAKVSMIIIC